MTTVPVSVAPESERSPELDLTRAQPSAVRSERRWRRVLGYLLVVLALGVPTAIQTMPPLSKLGSQVAPNDGDPLFNAWTMGWEAHALTHHPSDLFAANIFYPRRDAVAWADNQIALVPAYALASAVSGGLNLLPYNVVTFLGFLGVGLAVYALALELLDDRLGALIAATVFSLSAMRSLTVGHTQLAGFLFVPLALVALLRFLRARSMFWAMALGVAAAATWLVTAYYAILLFVVVVSFVAVWAAQRRFRVGRRFWPGIAVAGTVASLMIGPTLPPYVALQRAKVFERSSLAVTSVRVHDFARVPPSFVYRTLVHVSRIPDYSREGLFPGMVLLGLAAIAVLAWIASAWTRSRRSGAKPATTSMTGSGTGGPAEGDQADGGIIGDRVLSDEDRDSAVSPLAAGAGLCLMLMVGPRRGTFSIPFLALRALLPGVSSMRALDRFWAFPLLCLALLAGRGAVLALRCLPSRWRTLAAGVVLAMVWAELLFRPPFVSVDLSPPTLAANRVLQHLPAGPVIELPRPLDASFPYVSARRQMRSLIDGNPRVDGYSSSTPPLTAQIDALVSGSSVPDAVPVLRHFGVRYVVLHGGPSACSSTYSPVEIEDLRAKLATTPGVAALYTAGPDVVARLEPAAIDRHVPAVPARSGRRPCA